MKYGFCLIIVLCLDRSTTCMASKEAESANDVIFLPLIPHQAVVERRRLEGRNNAAPEHYPRHLHDSVAPLYQGIGTHYVDLWVGTPSPQRQTVIVDTGSGVTAFPCTGCKSCGQVEHHLDDIFYTDKSTSFSELVCTDCLAGRCSSGSNDQQCRVSRMYAEGSSWNAHECQDYVYIGGPHNEAIDSDAAALTNPWDPLATQKATGMNMKFGCQTSVTNLFLTQWADGIMGMNTADSAYWQQLAKEKNVNKEFSLCFTIHSKYTRDGTQAGGMTIGGTSNLWHSTPMVYAALNLETDSFYRIHVRALYVVPYEKADDDRETVLADPNLVTRAIKVESVTEVQLNGRKAIVDSGTTDTYIPSSVRQAFRTAFESAAGRSWTERMSLTEEEIGQLPTIIVQLTGDDERNSNVLQEKGTVPGFAGSLDPDHLLDILIAIPPAHYLVYLSDAKTYETSIFIEGSETVLGANTMMGHDILFGTSLGVAESDCDYHQALEQFGEGTGTSDPEPTPDDSDPAPTPDDSDPEPTPDDGDSEPSNEGSTPTEEPKNHDEANPGQKPTTPSRVERPSPPSASSDEGTCSTSTCRFGVVAGVSLVVVLLGWRIRTRHSRHVSAAYHQAHLELTEMPLDALEEQGYRDNEEVLATRGRLD